MALARGGGRGPDDGDQPVAEPDREVPAGGGKGDGRGRPGGTEIEHPAAVGAGRGLPEPFFRMCLTPREKKSGAALGRGAKP